DSNDAAHKTLVADAGYGSQENLELLESLGTQAYVKYGMFDKQQHETYNNKKPFRSDRLFYNKELQVLICPMGQQMNTNGKVHKKTKSGFLKTYTKYHTKNCYSCLLNGS